MMLLTDNEVAAIKDILTNNPGDYISQMTLQDFHHYAIKHGIKQINAFVEKANELGISSGS